MDHLTSVHWSIAKEGKKTSVCGRSEFIKDYAIMVCVFFMPHMFTISLAAIGVLCMLRVFAGVFGGPSPANFCPGPKISSSEPSLGVEFSPQACPLGLDFVSIWNDFKRQNCSSGPFSLRLLSVVCF